LEYARTSETSDEFDALIGLAGEKDNAAASETSEFDQAVQSPKLPEG